MPTTSRAGSWPRRATTRGTPGPPSRRSTTPSPRWLLELRSLPSAPAVLAAGGREHEIPISLDDFARAGKTASRAPGRGGAGPRGRSSGRCWCSPPARRVSRGSSAHLREHSGLEVLRAALRRDACSPPCGTTRASGAPGDALAPRHPPSRLGRPRRAACGPSRGPRRPAAHAPGARRGGAPRCRPDGLTVGTAPPVGTGAACALRRERHRRRTTAPLVCARRASVGSRHASGAVTLLNGEPATGRLSGPRRRPAAPRARPAVELLLVASRPRRIRREAHASGTRGLRAVLHGLHLLRLRGHHPALHDPEQRPVAPRRRRARPAAGRDEPAGAGGARGPGQPGGAAQHPRRGAPGQRHHGRASPPA